jgi:RNA polymerase sigma factor for flagellar operon FliA
MLDEVALYRAEEAANGDNAQIRTRLARLVNELPERESMIVRHHDFQQIPFDEIAASMELTKGRVSQIHRRAMSMLRDGSRGHGVVDLALQVWPASGSVAQARGSATSSWATNDQRLAPLRQCQAT